MSMRNPQSQRPLAVESLERRDLCAGDVWVSVEGQMLVLWGDAADNSVALTYDSNTQSYRVLGREAGGSMTTVNGRDTSDPANVLSFTGVRQVAVLLNGGSDTFEVDSPEAVDTVINKWMAIHMGDGDDTVILGRAGNAPGGAAPVATTLRTGTTVNVDLGNGNDHLEIANADIGLWLNVTAGEGNDEVLFKTEHTFEGDDEATLFPVRVRNSSSINLGSGEDTLSIRHALFGRHVRILDSAGAADIELYNVTIHETLDVDTAHEADKIALHFVYAKNFTLDTNGSLDDVDLVDARFKILNVKLGSARDQLLLRNVRVSLMTHLDGGEQGSSLARGPGNQLRGLTQRNLG